MQEGVARFFKKTTETPFQRPITAPISIQTAASRRQHPDGSIQAREITAGNVFDCRGER
jgi:hypothetical protein